MIKAGYEQIIERIAKHAALSKDEVERRIEAKRAKLSGLISKEGAAQVLAAELGISFDRQRLKISEILSGMRRISVVAMVMRIFPIRTYTRKEIESKVANMIIADETGSIRAVFWDTNHIAMIERGEISEGKVIEIKDASVRDNELHLGSLADLRLSSEQINNAVIRESFNEKMLEQLNANDRASIRAFLLQIFEPKFFYVCPECSLKAQQENNQFTCIKHGNIIPKERAIVTSIIDDGSNNIRAVCFSECIPKLLGVDDIGKLKDIDFFIGKRNELLGKELIFSGMARQNKMFGSIEFIISDIVEFAPQEIIEKLKNAS